MGNELAIIEFHGSKLDAIRDPDGEIWVSVRRVCEALGIDNATQQQKLKNKPWARVGVMPTRDTNGKTQKTCMLHVNCIPVWLGQIELNKISDPTTREKLTAFQLECADVLKAHFLGQRKEIAPPMPTIAELIPALLQQLVPLIGEVVRASLAQTQPARTVHAMGPRYSVKDRLEAKDWEFATTKQRAQIRQETNRRLDREYEDVPDIEGGRGSAHLYHGYQITILDQTIDKYRARHEKKENAQPNLLNQSKTD